METTNSKLKQNIMNKINIHGKTNYLISDAAQCFQAPLFAAHHLNNALLSRNSARQMQYHIQTSPRIRRRGSWRAIF
jgi:hypothetical protein